MALLKSVCSSNATVLANKEELANVLTALCEDAQVYEFGISTIVASGKTMFSICFDHSPSPDFENSKSYQLEQLRRRKLLSS